LSLILLPFDSPDKAEAVRLEADRSGFEPALRPVLKDAGLAFIETSAVSVGGDRSSAIKEVSGSGVRADNADPDRQECPLRRACETASGLTLGEIVDGIGGGTLCGRSNAANPRFGAARGVEVVDRLLAGVKNPMMSAVRHFREDFAPRALAAAE
jgi:hypothetical protein